VTAASDSSKRASRAHRLVPVMDNAGWWEVYEMSAIVFEQVKELATRLSPADRARIVEWLEATLSDESGTPAPTALRRSLYGLCADLGLRLTDKDIEESRREMWSNFPHEDIV
jgi:hypothetical protein